MNERVVNQFGKRNPQLAGCLCIAAILLACCLSALARQPRQDSVASIGAALQAEDFAKADLLARSSLKESPSDPKLWTLDGIALASLGKHTEALRAFNTALKFSPDFIAALEGAAQIEYQQGSNRAAPLLEHVLRLRPGDPTSHAMLGVIAYKRQDCKSAIEHFRASGSLLSSQPSALEEFGACLVRENQPAQAVGIFQQMLAGSPGNKRILFQLGAAQYLAQQSQDAVATLQPLLQEPDPAPQTLDLASLAYEESGDTPRAVALLRQAIVDSPGTPEYYLDFATLSYNHSSFQVGIDMLNVGLARLPRSSQLYLARGVLYVQLAQYDKAAADFETAERLDPKQAFSSDAQGLAQFERSDLDRALVTVRAQLKLHPNDAFLHYLLAATLAQKGAVAGTPEFREALGEAARAVQLKPDLALARDVLGELYLKSGQTSQAVEQSRVALRQDPTDQSALYHLIQALRSNDREHEIPGLLKRLASLREDSQEHESAQNQYRLIEPNQKSPRPAPGLKP